jgi:hypothetical protein
VILSTNVEILKSSLSKYEVAELHIEHYTSISFYAIFILTYALLIKYILIIYGTLYQLLLISYVAESTTKFTDLETAGISKRKRKSLSCSSFCWYPALIAPPHGTIKINITEWNIDF